MENCNRSYYLLFLFVEAMPMEIFAVRIRYYMMMMDDISNKINKKNGRLMMT